MVSNAKKDKDGRRVYDKRHACLFCGTLVSKLARHVKSSHKGEEVVGKCLALNNQKDIKDMWSTIRRKGDFLHNSKVLKTGGEIILVRRPAPGVNVNPNKCVPCTYCLGFFLEDQLSRHCAICPNKTTENSPNGSGTVSDVKKGRLMLYPNQTIQGASIELEQFVLDRMNKDEITDLVKKDGLINTYGSFLLINKGARKLSLVSQNMRLLSRLLIEVRKRTTDNCLDLRQFLTPSNFDLTVDVTKSLGGYFRDYENDEGLPGFKKPSVPLKIGYAIGCALTLKQGMAIRCNNQQEIDDCLNFQNLMKSEWSVRISSASLRTLSNNKFNRDDVLPFTSDLLKLKDYCCKRRAALMKEKEVTLNIWRELAEVTVTLVTIFNKRRGNEASSVLLKRFLERDDHSKSIHTDIVDSLTPLEQKLMER